MKKHFGIIYSIISFIFLLIGIIADNFINISFFKNYARLAWYFAAYFPVAVPVLRECYESLCKKQVFTEFTLMLLATIGAFVIGEYPEAVAVMLFYAVGDLFQMKAVTRAKNNIKALLDVRPNIANVIKNNKIYTMRPEDVLIGETIQVKAGEKVPLDGLILNTGSHFNTSALTGESTPKNINKGETVLAGMLNLNNVVEILVTKTYFDTSISRIIEIVQNAPTHKAKTEIFIRKFAKIYTPAVFFMAVAVAFIPYFFTKDYIFTEWLYRALVFLVISCPCALVISIPLGFFGGIGAASKHGILFKGANFLDLITKVNTVVMDKTGTLTKGVFRVQKIVTEEMDERKFICMLAALESKSTHPVARAILEYVNVEYCDDDYSATEVSEIHGCGLRGTVNGCDVVAGNTKLLRTFKILYDSAVDSIEESVVVMAINGKYAGYVLIADEIREDAKQSICQLCQREIVILSGDKLSITQKVAKEIGVEIAYGDLLPEEKAKKIEDLRAIPLSGSKSPRVIAFVGDGINDAPALACSDIGIAMGAMSSDVAIETADVVIQSDQLSKIYTAIKIGHATRAILKENIFFTITIKVLILLLGAFGLASIWGAVFADVGVALLAIANAVRIQRKRFL